MMKALAPVGHGAGGCTWYSEVDWAMRLRALPARHACFLSPVSARVGPLRKPRPRPRLWTAPSFATVLSTRSCTAPMAASTPTPVPAPVPVHTPLLVCLPPPILAPRVTA
eukprot:1548844-Pleurochrysis_carterae.AAC.8